MKRLSLLAITCVLTSVTFGSATAQTGGIIFSAPMLGPIATTGPDQGLRDPIARVLPAYPILPTINVAPASSSAVVNARTATGGDLFPLNGAAGFSSYAVPVPVAVPTPVTGTPVYQAQPSPARPGELRVLRYVFDPNNPSAITTPIWSEPLTLP